MKKNYFIILLLIIAFISTGCGNSKTKEVTDVETFTTSATTAGFTVSDNSDTYQEYNYVLSSTVAIIDELNIEMVVYDTTENAKKSQEQQIEKFNLLKSANAIIKKDEGQNYYRYIMVANGKYMITSRIDNTLIFCKTDTDNSEKVEKLFDTLGY